MEQSNDTKENSRPGSSEISSSRPLGEQVYDRIKKQIRSGSLQPGDPLSENQLADEMDISRTPIREALQKLDQEGFVQNRPGQAVTVAKPSMQEVLDVIHVRSVLSPELAKLVADSISEGTVKKLSSALDRMKRSVDEDREQWAEADETFHRTLYNACPNTVLGKTLERMWSRIHHLTLDSQTSTKRISQCTGEHEEILNAIKERNPEQAENKMKEHIKNLRESTFRKMSHDL